MANFQFRLSARLAPFLSASALVPADAPCHCAFLGIQAQKIALNGTCSHLIRLNRTILKHFFRKNRKIESNQCCGGQIVCKDLYRNTLQINLRLSRSCYSK